MLKQQLAAKHLIDESIPVIKALGEAFGGVRVGKTARQRGREARGSARRIDVVSEKLCDDVIQYLAPTLEQHKGCTILDVHPGACVFSSKIHDYLKPKRHILMEPEERYFQPFIKPLLDAPGSKYRWTSLTGAHPKEYWQNYRTVLDDPKLCDPRPEFSLRDPARRKLDPSMLLIGNLYRRYQTRSLGYRNVFWNMVIQQMSYAALNNSMFHRDGLVRMLWWLPEDEKHLYFPQTEVWRQNFQVAMSIATDTNEVVGTTRHGAIGNRIRGRRADIFENLVAGWAQQSAQEKGMSAPAGREYLGFDSSDKVSTMDVVSPTDIVSHTVAELEKELDEAYALLKKIETADDVDTRRLMPIPDFDFDFPQTVPIAERLASKKVFGGGSERIAVHLELFLRTVRLEATYAALEEASKEDQTADARVSDVDAHHHMKGSIESSLSANEERKTDESPEESTLSRLRDRILSFDEQHRENMAPRGYQMIERVDQLVEEQVSIFARRPLMPRERRAYEPLKADMSEFFPRREMMLLDMVPTARDLSVPGLADAQEANQVCHELLKKLFEKRALSLPDGLTRLGPNAAQDLIPMIPAFTDARLGGRLNPQRLKVRMLTDDMIEDLIKAFIEWPFRPSLLELELSSMSDTATVNEGVSTSTAFSVVDESQ